MAAAKLPEGGVRGPSDVTSAWAGRDTEGVPRRWCWMEDVDGPGVRWPLLDVAAGDDGVDMVVVGMVLALAGISNGFGCSRPSAEARGVS